MLPKCFFRTQSHYSSATWLMQVKGEVRSTHAGMSLMERMHTCLTDDFLQCFSFDTSLCHVSAVVWTYAWAFCTSENYRKLIWLLAPFVNLCCNYFCKPFLWKTSICIYYIKNAVKHNIFHLSISHFPIMSFHSKRALSEWHWKYKTKP